MVHRLLELRGNLRVELEGLLGVDKGLVDLVQSLKRLAATEQDLGIVRLLLQCEAAVVHHKSMLTQSSMTGSPVPEIYGYILIITWRGSLNGSRNSALDTVNDRQGLISMNYPP